MEPARRDVEQPPARQVGEDGDVAVSPAARSAAAVFVSAHIEWQRPALRQGILGARHHCSPRRARHSQGIGGIAEAFHNSEGKNARNCFIRPHQPKADIAAVPQQQRTADRLGEIDPGVPHRVARKTSGSSEEFCPVA